MPLRDGGQTAEERQAEHQAVMDAKVIVTRCGVPGCGWKWEGPAGEGRDIFAQHRRLQHKDQIGDPPPDPLLDVVRDIIGHGETVEIRLPEMPVKWRRDWIKRLGGRIVIDKSAPMPLQLQRDKAESNGHAEVEGLEALERMDGGEPQRPIERSEPVSVTCKIEGCAEPYASARGRWAKLCETHKAEAVAVARAEGSLGSKLPRPVPEPEPELEPTAEPEPLPAVPIPAPLPARPLPAEQPADPESVDVFELFEHMATEERIEYYERLSLDALRKRDALVAIREALDSVRVVEA